MTEVLVGDIGGTSARFALVERLDGQYRVHSFRKYVCDDYPSFYDVLGDYLNDAGFRVPSALFALAGPPEGQAITLTNRPWTISTVELESRFDFEQVRLVNDFTAMARSVPEMPDTAFQEIKPGSPIVGEPELVMGPGTGLGVATIVETSDNSWKIIGGEGGHGAYAPTTEKDWAVFQVLQRDHGYIPNELVCAGVGFEKLHKAIAEVGQYDYVPLTAAEVSVRAKQGDPLSLQICRFRARTVLRVAGDIALANGARGGVTLAGGVSAKLSDFLSEADSLAQFVERGVQTDYMTQIPIRLLTDETASLVGAAALHYDFVLGC